MGTLSGRSRTGPQRGESLTRIWRRVLKLEKRSVLGIQISPTDYAGAVEQIRAAAQAGHSFLVAALAVHGVMTGVLDPHQRYRLNQFDLALPDGQPVRWALNLLHGCGLRERVYGPRLTLELCRAFAESGLPIYFYGSRPEVLGRLLDNLSRSFPSLVVAGAKPSRFRTCSQDEKQDIAAEIRASGARLVFVGLGCPRQEVWAYEFRELLDMPVVAVGAAFDFHAGTLAQAPGWMQDHGLEWLFRLLKEPRRLWRRYLGLNPLFLSLLLVQWMAGSGAFGDPGTRPVQECRYA